MRFYTTNRDVVLCGSQHERRLLVPRVFDEAVRGVRESVLALRQGVDVNVTATLGKWKI